MKASKKAGKLMSAMAAGLISLADPRSLNKSVPTHKVPKKHSRSPIVVKAMQISATNKRDRRNAKRLSDFKKMGLKPI